MVRLACAFALLLLPLCAFADEELEPADYFKIIEESKLRYNILGEPSKTPVEEKSCPRRDESTRVIVDGGTKKLVARTVAPEAQKLLGEGEEHFQAKRMEQAVEKFKAAVAADPQAPGPYFFLGDAILFGSRDAEAALEQYRKGIALDPSIPAGHFFASTAYTRLGRLKEAREEIVQALTFYPGYEGVWKIGTQNPAAWGIKPMVRHAFEPPAGYLGRKGPDGVDIFFGKDLDWLGYAICKAAWANEERFNRNRKEGEWSLEEERACVLNQMFATFNTTEAGLEEKRKERGETAGPVPLGEVIAALPACERHIHDVSREGLLDGYILFEILGQRCPAGMSILQDDARAEVEKYIRRYVVVASE